MFRPAVILFFLSQIGFLPLLQAQVRPGTIKGTVTDKNGNAIPFISVLIKETSKGVATNSNGVYQLTAMEPGHYTLTVSGMGFASKQKEVNLNPGQNLKLDFQLAEKALEMDEVVINGLSEASRLRESAKAITVVETKRAKLQTADLGEVLTQVAGINVRRDGGLGSGTRFSLNGLTDDQVRFMIDGIPLDFMGYSAGIGNVPVNLIDRAEIYKGVVPIALGADALGGAVNLVSSKKSSRTSGSISYQTGSFGTHRVTANGEVQLNDAGLFARGNAYYDYSKNNYKVDVNVPDERGKLREVSVRRFHDAYEAYGLRGTIGVQNRDWTDELSLEVFGNRYDKEIQNNNIMSIVYGEITSGEDNYGALARYRNQFSDKFSLNASFGHTERQVTFVDTSKYIYTWFGDKVRDSEGNIKESKPGELGQATDLLTTNRSTYGRFNFTYQLAQGHDLQLSSAPTRVSQNIDERYLQVGQTVTPPDERRKTFSWVNGLAYNWKSENKTIENNLFAKDYVQEVSAEEQTNGAPIDRDRQSHTMGFGDNIRYKPNKRWLFKASYEWATRLPRPAEIFGDGRLIRPNLNLKPERSHNVNLQIDYQNKPTASSNWNVSLSGFLRETDKLILLLGNNEVFSYQNVFAARSLGAETSAYWESPDDRFRVEVNATWQDFRNQSSKGAFGNYKGDRIPNRPYLFANGKVNYRIPKLLTPRDDFSIFLTNRYVHEFYRSWESVGLKKFKDVIPSQFVQNLGVTYEFPINGLTTALTAEVQNLMDTDVYDFFGVQKPGRAFYVKLTTQF